MNILKKLILMLCCSLAFGQVKELTDKNFNKAIARGVVVVEFWAGWNEVNKVTLLDEWETFEANVYRINIELYPKIQAYNKVVVLPTIIFYDEGEEMERLQGSMQFKLETTIKELDEMVTKIMNESKFN